MILEILLYLFQAEVLFGSTNHLGFINFDLPLQLDSFHSYYNTFMCISIGSCSDICSIKIC
jgi:hypothetical protein